jgi:hypothetical protein
MQETVIDYFLLLRDNKPITFNGIFVLLLIPSTISIFVILISCCLQDIDKVHNNTIVNILFILFSW